MKHGRTLTHIALATVLAFAVMASTAFASPAQPGGAAYEYMEQLATASRIAGEASEYAAAGLIEDWFDELGYSAMFQPFSYSSSGKQGYSQNVVAYLPSTSGQADVPLVIVGAHYDSVTAGDGADDNASGVGCMLEIAEKVAEYDREYDIAFVAFGAEEVGLRGSAYFAKHMPEGDKARAVAMINFDSLAAGDKMYIHSGFNRKTGPRDRMLELIQELGLPIETQPGLNEHYPAGLTPDGFSDYTAFNRAGIPVAAFEATNWEIGDLDGYRQTEKYGSFWHTGKDKLDTIEQRFPGRPMERLAAFTTLVESYLLDPLQ